jgi:hypothetical protein
MAQMIVPEQEAVNYTNTKYAYTDQGTETDFYYVDDAYRIGKTGTIGNSENTIAGQLAKVFNLNSASTAAQTKTSGAPGKKFNIIPVVVIVAVIIAAVWAYKKWVK